MELSNITENSVVSGTDGGQSTANLNYILYILGFFVVVTTLIGVILAYLNRDTASQPFRSHLDWQIRIFWRGVTFGVANAALYIIATFIGATTYGLGFVLLLAPFGLSIWWFIWTIMAIARGMKALGRREEIPG